MDLYNETKLEYINEQELIETVDNSLIQDNIENDIYIDINDDFTEGCIDELKDDEIININNIYLQNKHLLLTNILNEQKIQINRKKYLYWLNLNNELLKSAYYILSKKFFNDKIKINFNIFTEFCFLYN
jgi:hypothetical protein